MNKFILHMRSIVKRLLPSFFLRYILNNQYYNINIDYYNFLGFYVKALLIAWGVSFALNEIIYWTYSQKNLTKLFYNMLFSKNFPNPWNYYLDDGTTYLKEIAFDEGMNQEIKEQAMRLRLEMDIIWSQGNLVNSNRVRYAFSLALARYFSHFKDEKQIHPDNIVYNHTNLSLNNAYLFHLVF